MRLKATSKYIRTSPRKIRLITDRITHMNTDVALASLSVMPKRAAEPIIKLLKSLLANAKQKNINGSFVINEIIVTSGPMMKRWRAVSRGRAHGYKKRMTHMTIYVSEMEVKSPENVSGGGK